MPFSEGGPDPRGVQTSAVRVTEGPTQLSPHPPGARSPPAEAAWAVSSPSPGGWVWGPDAVPTTRHQLE